MWIAKVSESACTPDFALWMVWYDESYGISNETDIL